MDATQDEPSLLSSAVVSHRGYVLSARFITLPRGSCVKGTNRKWYQTYIFELIALIKVFWTQIIKLKITYPSVRMVTLQSSISC